MTVTAGWEVPTILSEGFLGDQEQLVKQQV
jgi:hypothetical protein